MQVTPKNDIFTNTIKVELYDLTYEHSWTLKNNKLKKKIDDVSPQMDERISYEEFSTNIKNLNDEQRLLIDDIVYKTNKYHSKPLCVFLIGGAWTGKFFTLMCIIQNMLRYYIKDITNVDLLKPNVMKLVYTGKVAFNIDGMTIHVALASPLNKTFNEFKALSDGKGYNS